MHPILAQRQRLGLYLAAWIPIAGLLAGLLVFAGHLSWVESLVLTVPLSGVYAFLCLSAWYLCRVFPMGKARFVGMIGIFTAAAALSSSIWIFIGNIWVLAISALPALAAIKDSYSVHTPLLFVVGVLLFFLAAAVHYLMSIFESSREAERQSLEFKILSREAELKALKAQIDPHFLFNSLNSISALTTVNPAASRTMCQLLADFLRKSLEVGTRDMISLDEELALVSSYLSIEQVRLGPRLTVRQEIAGPTRNCGVPPLLLQPLMENAVRHGIAQLVGGGEILIIAARHGSRLEIHVANPCDPDQPVNLKKGIGLANVRSRLRALYESEAKFEFHRTDTRFESIVTLPAVEFDGRRQPPAASARPETPERKGSSNG